MKKSKLKWVYYSGELFDVHVTPNLIKRLHAPIEPDLEYVTSMQCRCLHLRPCAVGLNKEGLITAWLYCTRSGRFFDHGKNGWVEQKFNYTPNRPSSNNGCCHSTYPILRHCSLLCHLLVAHAWLGARPEGKVCDHKDTNVMNWRANNLEWVIPAENCRRAGIARKLRRVCIDPKRLHTNLLDGIFKLPDELIGTLTGTFLWLSQYEYGDVPLDYQTLNLTIAAALDYCERMQKSDVRYKVSELEIINSKSVILPSRAKNKN